MLLKELEKEEMLEINGGSEASYAIFYYIGRAFRALGRLNLTPNYSGYSC